ncbi:response regulator transcription factor [Corynebacterium aquatimens]|uniref:DNA-binding response OmpR family regulator n=1 Tax=Corynebacterium aquatimens TaxID=1190508 RepID=A0A931E067_9CORY|nr:DNA-binding response OmpR family regulator [Corynebacterium aquatimens]WJY66127.1 Transcriptional regulatory protein TcrA [Corynebacterium aquatimens]
MPRVMVVEDEQYLAEAIAKVCARQGWAVETALRGDDAVAYLAHSGMGVDVVVLDRDLPGIHGDDVCATITREHPHIKVLMLTAAATLDDKVDGFGLGADDYLTKPFEVPELIARITALMRRHAPRRTSVVAIGDVRVDTSTRQITRAGEAVRLSPKEYAVLSTLIDAEGAVISAEELLEEAWDENADPFSNSIRVTISHLRRKLGEPWIIHTMPGAGYYVAEAAYQ